MIGNIKKILIFMSIGVPILLFSILFIVIISTGTASSDSSILIAVHGFSIPFEDTSLFSITGEFGNRVDPFGSGTVEFHSGMDLGSPCGTNIVASADGIVYEIGYSESGLGNYVFIQHDTDIGVIYTIYGHMLDNSIIVETGQFVDKGQVIGQVGTTGASTGCHLHFTIMKEKISYEKEYLINPQFVIRGLD